MIYDLFQQQAISYVDQEISVLVSAPTGAGKTAIAEHVILQCLTRGEKVIYTAPIKALSNQKFRDFNEAYQNKVGILTGDVTINPDAPVLIMTTEIFRNKILEPGNNLDQYKWIIFDEIHYIDDYERGTVWEESLIFMPKHMNILGLSATVPNVDELKQWLELIHGNEVKIVKETNRPVPLSIFFQCEDKIFQDVHKMARYSYRNARSYSKRLSKSDHVKPNRLSTLIENLKDTDRLPCIYFAFSRKKTEELAEEMTSFNFLSDIQRDEIVYVYETLCKRFDLINEPSAEKLKPLVAQGIAYHHAGMLPTLKEVVERLFTSRLLKLIFTTETFALGINMPARSVIFDELRKFYGRGFDILRTRDFYQMAGRAGRRSIDTEGFVFCKVNPHYISIDQLNRIVNGQPEKVYSQFNASYATILNLYQTYGEKLYDIYPKSFHYFQAGKHNRRRAVTLMQSKVDILKEMGHIENQHLTIKGQFACKIYGYELILADMFESGLLEQLSINELAVLILGIVYEPRKGNKAPKPPLTHTARRMEDETKKIYKHIQRLERAVGSPDITKKCFFHLSFVIEEWIKGKNFHEVLRHTEADEGEIVRYFRMTIQVLRQLAESPVSHSFKDKLFKLIGMINRDVIDSEKQLRS